MNSKQTKTKRHILAWSLIVLPGLLVLTFWGLSQNMNKLSMPPGYFNEIEAQGFSVAQSLRPGDLGEAQLDLALRIGMASEILSIKPGDSLAGYLQIIPRRSRNTGQVQVGAMAISKGTTSVVITSLDSVTVSASLRRDIAAALPKNVHLMTTASHVHSGPGGFGDSIFQRLFLGAADPDLRQRLLAALVQVSQQALSNMHNADIEFGRVEASQLLRPRGLTNTYIDPSLDLLKLRSDDGKALGSWVFFAAHATLVGDRQKADGDYPYVLCQELQKNFSAPVLFSASATGSASSMLKDPNKEGLAIAAVVEKMSTTEIKTETPLHYQRVQIEMPPPAFPLFLGRTLQTSLSAILLPRSLPIDILRIGTLVLVSLPGELSAELSLGMRRHFAEAGLQLIIASHNGAYGGYFMPATRYDNGSIEAPMEFYGPMAGQVFVRFLAGLRWGLTVKSKAE